MLELAKNFASLMNQNKYLEAGKLMSKDCRYIYQNQIISGVDAILKTYIDNYAIAQKQLDEIQFFSEVLPFVDNSIFKLKYLDRIRKGNSWFEHKCELHIKIENGKVIEIEHFDLPSEAEKLNKWRVEVGIKK